MCNQGLKGSEALAKSTGGGGVALSVEVVGGAWTGGEHFSERMKNTSQESFNSQHHDEHEYSFELWCKLFHFSLLLWTYMEYMFCEPIVSSSVLKGFCLHGKIYICWMKELLLLLMQCLLLCDLLFI